MNTVFKKKLSSLDNDIKDCLKILDDIDIYNDKDNLDKLFQSLMEKYSYDDIFIDEAGNIIGCINGYTQEEDIILLGNIDLNQNIQSVGTDVLYRNKMGITEINKAALVTTLFCGVLLKRSISALTGNLYICLLPRYDCCDYGVQYLFNNFFKNKKFKGVILSEPTNFNINVGNKGRMEYQINVKGAFDNSFLPNSNLNVMNMMYPLINELEKVSGNLSKDRDFGESSLMIKDVSYSKKTVNNQSDSVNVIVDRTFSHEENSQSILNKAKQITDNVYSKPQIDVTTSIMEDNIVTNNGQKKTYVKEYKPWKIEAHHPFVYTALKTLQENDFKTDISYWKKIVTEGSYTFGELNIPTIGFGLGNELEPNKKILLSDIKKSIYGKALIIYRSIGMPTFGWSSDEI